MRRARNGTVGLRCPLAAVPIALMLTLIVGCSAPPADGPPATSNLDSALPPTVTLKDGLIPPTTTLRGVPFDRRLTTHSPVLLPQGGALEFLPCVLDATGTSATLALDWIPDTGDPQRLGEFTAFPLAIGAWAKSDLMAMLRHRVRLDLKDLAGDAGRLQWTLAGGGEKASGFLAMPVLRSATSAARPPHILMICSDTHRHDFSIAGEGPDLMPHLTALRSEAVTYQRAFSSASWTLPSIASTMTGRFPRFHTTGRRTRTIPNPGADAKPDDREGEFWIRWGETVRYVTAFPTSGVTTLDQALGDAGYLTAWITANPFYVISGLGLHEPDFFVAASGLNGSDVNAAVAQLLYNLPADRPVFLLVHYLDVHEYKNWILKREHPGETPQMTGQATLLESYRKAVRLSDDYLGSLLAQWKAKFGLDNSLVVFWSDHGEHLQDAGYPTADEWRRMVADGTGDPDNPPAMVGHGNSMDEVLLHVPLVIRYPDAMGLRGEDDRTAALVDIMPTVLNAADIPHEGLGLDGRSLVRSGAESGGDRRAIHADYQFNGGELSSVREGDRKFVARLGGSGEIESSYLVDLSAPAGTAGEAGQRIGDPAELERLTRRFQDYRKAATAAEAGLTLSHKADSEEAGESLRNLGYVAP